MKNNIVHFESFKKKHEAHSLEAIVLKDLNTAIKLLIKRLRAAKPLS